MSPKIQDSCCSIVKLYGIKIVFHQPDIITIYYWVHGNGYDKINSKVHSGGIMTSLTRKTVHVTMHLINGDILQGTVVIEKTSRLSDTMNNLNKDFIVLMDYKDKGHIINKAHIVQIMENEDLEIQS